MSVRRDYSTQDEDFLAQYIAKYCLKPQGRSGNALYQTLCEDTDRKWPFSTRHSWQSWRNHYLHNRDRMDDMINRHIERTRLSAPSSSQTPAPSQSSRYRKRSRNPFTDEDDQYLTEYLVENRGRSGRLGQKLYMALEDTDKYPWAAQHPWCSWRERYKKNEEYFDGLVHARVTGDHSELRRLRKLKPRTAEDIAVPRRSSQMPAKMAAVSEKRKRVASAVREESPSPPRKKRHVQEERDERPVAGPSKPRTSQHRHPPNEASEVPVVDEVQSLDVVEAEQGEEVVEDGDSGEEANGDASEEEGELGPPGSPDYRGEIFYSTTEAAVVEDRESEPQPELDELDETDVEVNDNVHLIAPSSPVTLGVEDKEEKSMLSKTADRDDADVGADADDSKPALSNTPPSGAFPPARRHNTRIQRDIDAGPGTPGMSPTEEADARHRREHDRSPAPPRKQIRRIRRSEDEDFFGTPSQSSAPSSPGDVSPTTRHLAVIREQDARDATPVKQREPPRLHEGAWNKVFSDARGKPRIGASGKSRRPSGVDFNEDAEVVGTQDIRNDDGSESEEEDVVKTPVPWPPVRHKEHAHVPITSTPARMASANTTDKSTEREAASDKLVTTEKIVSVKTVRTIQRRIPRALDDTSHGRADLGVAQDTAILGSPQDVGVDVAVDFEHSQHHPFSQRQPRRTRSGSGSMSLGSTLFPRVNSTVERGVAIHKNDVARLGRMLDANRNRNVKIDESAQASPSKIERDVKRRTGGPLPAAHRALLVKLLKTEQQFASPSSHLVLNHASTSLSRETMSAGAARVTSAERFAMFKEHEEELSLPQSQSSPLADKGDTARRNSLDEIPRASNSRSMPTATLSHPDKRKARADAPFRLNENSRRYTLATPGSSNALQSRANGPIGTQRAVRPSLPSSFTLGEDLSSSYRTAVSLAFNPPLSEAGRARSYTVSHSARASRSVSPDSELIDTLLPNELSIIQKVGMQTVLHVMARNHGFSEETVRRVYAETRSLEAADHLLCEMRESANETANKTLRSLLDDDPDEDNMQGDAERDDQAGHANEQNTDSGEEAEVEDTLVQDSWFHGDGPQAESSRLYAMSIPSRRSRPLLIEPLVHVPEPNIDSEYSPPKRTRAARFLAQRDEEQASSRSRGSPASLAGYHVPSIGLGELASCTPDRLLRGQKQGPAVTKIATGKALGKLLKMSRDGA